MTTVEVYNDGELSRYIEASVTGEQERNEGLKLDINSGSCVELLKLVIRGAHDSIIDNYRVVGDGKYLFELNREVTINSPINNVRLQKFDYFDMRYEHCSKSWYAMFYVSDFNRGEEV
jgi:hypothetical protein